MAVRTVTPRPADTPFHSPDRLGVVMAKRHAIPDRSSVVDDDGVLFLGESSLRAVVDAAADIHQTERRQADQMREGTSFRKQIQFSGYLAARATNPGLGLREYLKKTNHAIEV